MKRIVATSVVGVGILAGILFLLFLKQPPTPSHVITPTPQPVSPVAQTILSLDPSSSVIAANESGTVAVIMDTKSNAVTAVQLELQYDPTILKTVTLTPGDFLPGAIVLINRTEAKSGHVTYALGISPAQQPVTGKGVIAKMAFTTLVGAKEHSTQIHILPQSLVTSSGIDGSVLRTVSNASLLIK